MPLPSPRTGTALRTISTRAVRRPPPAPSQPALHSRLVPLRSHVRAEAQRRATRNDRVSVSCNTTEAEVRREGRRGVLGLGLALCLCGGEAAEASLVQFPLTEDDLRNTYYLVRAGESVREEAGVVYTNPVAKTSMDSGLSETGKQQVVKGTAPTLKAALGPDASPWLWPSINQRSYQTAEILAYEFQVGRNRIVPEYSFLDARGLGALEGQRLDIADATVGAGDRLDPSWKMTKGTDGTPNESVYDVLVRMRQLLSITETQYFGEIVIFISPDSDCLSILQAAAVGADLRRHREFAFRAGEARMLEAGVILRDDSPTSIPCPRPPACV